MTKKKKKKKKKTFRVVGCGGIGTALLDPLCRYLNYHPEYRDERVEVTFIDGDEYEERNRERQAFGEIGNKAEVTAKDYQEKFPNLSITARPEYISQDNIITMIRDGDIVFGCVDNHSTRKLISDHCEELDNVVLVSGGNDYDDGNVQIHIKVDGQDLTLPIANDYHPEVQEPEDENPADTMDREGGCDVQVQSEPQLVLANNYVATGMLNMPDEVYLDVVANKSRPVFRSQTEEADLKSLCDGFLEKLDGVDAPPEFRDAFNSLRIRFSEFD
jgi:molybdopterin/thiamine biosynthesis adenylyltransferase